MARLLVNPGDVVVVERPAYLAALQTFALAQASLRSIDSDANGACVEQVDEVLDASATAGQSVKLIYVVANFANPSGATLSTSSTRWKLCNWKIRMISTTSSIAGMTASTEAFALPLSSTDPPVAIR